MADSMEELTNRYIDLKDIGAGFLVRGLRLSYDHSYVAHLYLESFLKVVATFAKNFGASDPILDIVLEWTDRSISDVGYDSRVIYSRTLELLADVLVRLYTEPG